jgi:enterochelin esterase-like enzyme
VYLLHGYGLTGERWMTFTNLAAAADKNVAAGTMREMILVNPDAFTNAREPYEPRAGGTLDGRLRDDPHRDEAA